MVGRTRPPNAQRCSHRRSAVHRQQARRRPRSRHPTGRASTCETSPRPSLSSARRPTTSRRRRRRSIGSSISMRPTRDPRTPPNHRLRSASLHRASRHLRLWISGEERARRIASNIDLIDVLPPGLYEAVMVPKDPAERAPILSAATISCALKRARSMTYGRSAAIPGDDRNFETAARVSDVNLGLYRTFVQP